MVQELPRTPPIEYLVQQIWMEVMAQVHDKISMDHVSGSYSSAASASNGAA